MERKIWRTFLWIAAFVLSFNISSIFAEEAPESINEPQLQEMTFLVSTPDLQINEEGISLKAHGNIYRVHSLRKNGNRWIAQVHGRVNYCPQGHLTCEACGMCHTERCRYYIKPCKLWD